MAQPTIPKTYLSRYGSESEPPPSPAQDDMVWSGDFDSGYGSENWDFFTPGDWEGNLEDPIGGSDRPGDDQLLSELSGDLPQMEEGNLQFQDELEALKNEIESDPIFIDKPHEKNSLLEKLQSLQNLSGQAGGNVDVEAGLDNLRTEFETQKEELQAAWDSQYGSVQEWVNYLKEQGAQDVTLEGVVDSLKAEGLEPSDLKDIVLPAKGETYKKLFNVLRGVDSDLRDMLDKNGDNPLRPEIQDRISQDLSNLLPRAGTVKSADVENVIIASVTLPWPSSSDIRAQFGADEGGNGVDNNSLNHEAGAIDDVINQALRTGDFSPDGVLKDRLYHTDSDGLNWDRGNKGSAFRRYLGAVYAAVGKDKTLFKAVLRQNLPQDVLMEIYAIFQPGGHPLQKTGDHLTTTDVVSIFEEIFAAPPLE